MASVKACGFLKSINMPTSSVMSSFAWVKAVDITGRPLPMA
jgi:hypothetical protein